ncbi:MAG: bifunctional diaminohydroxyphosphoribosylaminopyrimidine deaminase/5-amino-6-(5-phosphoribosylamino)uracil reductase RibD, partial [Gammaproteobacteria bacterium]
EPCSHQGQTPPCVKALVEAKVSRVVAAMKDPNPLVNGEGLVYLRSHNIETSVNILEAEALDLNKGFIKRMTTDRPYITVKSAVSLDGKTAMQSGESKWISSDASRLDVQRLRARSCAIMTGIDTVIEDNPNLNVRLDNIDLNIGVNFQQPKRVILDTHLRIPPNANVLNHSEEVIIYTCVVKDKIPIVLKNCNAEIVTTKLDDQIDLSSVMSDLAERGINEVLVEAGSTLVGSLFEHKLVDEMIVYLAPHIMGDAGHGLAKLNSIQSMEDRINLEILQSRKIGDDIKLQLKPQYSF